MTATTSTETYFRHDISPTPAMKGTKVRKTGANFASTTAQTPYFT